MNNHGPYIKHLAGVEGVIFQRDEIDTENVEWMNAIIKDREKYGREK